MPLHTELAGLSTWPFTACSNATMPHGAALDRFGAALDRQALHCIAGMLVCVRSDLVSARCYQYMFTQRLWPWPRSQVLLMHLHTELAGLATVPCTTCSHLLGQTWSLGQVLPIHDHSSPGSVARYLVLVLVRSCLASEPSAAYTYSHRACIYGSVVRCTACWYMLARPGLRARCCQYMFPQGLPGTACLHV